MAQGWEHLPPNNVAWVQANSGVDAIYGLSLLSVILFFCSERFFSGYSRFPSP